MNLNKAFLSGIWLTSEVSIAHARIGGHETNTNESQASSPTSTTTELKGGNIDFGSQSHESLKTTNGETYLKSTTLQRGLVSTDLLQASNVAKGKNTFQTSTGWGGDASRAVDGKVEGDYWKNSVTHTATTTERSYWEVELGDTFQVTKVRVWNRTDCCSERLSKANVILLSGNTGVARKALGDMENVQSMDVEMNAIGDKVRIYSGEEGGYLSLAEVEVFGVISEAKPADDQETSWWDQLGPDPEAQSANQEDGTGLQFEDNWDGDY